MYLNIIHNQINYVTINDKFRYRVSSAKTQNADIESDY